jgi:hypothetical protein
MGIELHNPLHPGPDLVVRPSIAADVTDMATRLRTEDQAEIVAASGQPPVVALGEGFAKSTPCYTVMYNGRPAAMFGIVPSDCTFPRLGNIWLLGTDDINVFSREFLRQSKSWLKTICEGYDLVGNLVDERNDKHVKWLKWLEFKFIRRYDEFGALGLPFLEFAKIVD